MFIQISFCHHGNRTSVITFREQRGPVDDSRMIFSACERLLFAALPDISRPPPRSQRAGGRAGLMELTLPPQLWLVFGSPSTSKVNICLAGNLCILPSCSLDSSWQIATQRGEGSAAPSHSQFKGKQIEVSAKSTNAKTRQDKKNSVFQESKGSL